MSVVETVEKQLFYALLARPLQELENELLRVKSVAFLADYPWPPGKRLRPMLFWLCHLAARPDGLRASGLGAREQQIGVAIELLHEASLIHDDIVDRSPTRRGRPALYVTSGDGLALLVGDYLIFRGLKMLLDGARSADDVHLAQELADTGLQLASGQTEQLYHFLKSRDARDRLSRERYLHVITAKTAYFFAGCAEAGAALAGAGREVRSAHREFGLHLGLAFQMVDDLMDALGDPRVAGKTLQNAASEGTITLPIVEACELSPLAGPLRKVARGQRLTGMDGARLYALLRTRPVLDRCRQSIHTHVTKAEGYLEQLPGSVYRLALRQLLEYVSRCPWGRLERRLSSPGLRRRVSRVRPHTR